MKKLIIAIVIVIIAVGSGVFFYASKDKKINETIDAIEDKNVKQVFKIVLTNLKTIMVK